MNESLLQPADVSFTRLSEFFLAEARKGTAPSVEQFAEAFPHLADEIRSNFPTLLILEQTLAADRGPVRPTFAKAEMLGGCRLEGEIGRGAMGTVYRAKQQELDRTVAIKVIALTPGAVGGIIDRFELERRAMARLDHPHIVPVYSYGHNDRCAYLVMKYIDGKSLDKLLAEDADYRSRALLTELRGDWTLFAKLAGDVAAGLHHTHELGLVHRDIKPANLMLDGAGKVWITDFGLAKIFDYARSMSRTGDAIGTPRYMAPEQLRGVCDARSDVYSLGITLYELAGGGQAWGAHSAQSLTVGRASLELNNLQAENPEVPEGLAKIIMKACEFAPDQRYQTCKELQFVLERFVAGSPKADRRHRTRDSNEVFRKKRRWLNVIIAATGLAAFVIGTATTAILRSAPKAKAPISAERTAAASNFLERLADAEQKDVVKVVHDYVKESIDESGSEFRLADQEKREIAKQVDVVMTDFDRKHQQGVPVEKQKAEMQKFMEGYRQSTIPTATRFVSVVRVIENSQLPTAEKQAGFETVRLFAKLIINRKINQATADHFLSALGGGKPVAQINFESLRLADASVRSWLAAVRRHIATIPGVSPNEKLDLTKEIERAKALATQPQAGARPNVPTRQGKPQ